MRVVPVVHRRAPRPAPRAIARRHLRAIEGRIARLKLLRDELAKVALSCEGGRAANCRVIDAIAEVELPPEMELGPDLQRPT